MRAARPAIDPAKAFNGKWNALPFPGLVEPHPFGSDVQEKARFHFARVIERRSRTYNPAATNTPPATNGQNHPSVRNPSARTDSCAQKNARTMMLNEKDTLIWHGVSPISKSALWSRTIAD